MKPDVESAVARAVARQLADTKTAGIPPKDPSRPHPLPVGAVLDGHYRVTRHLGEGGMGLVVHACDERLQREVAIKLVRPELLAVSDAHQRFLAEARAMARLVHPNVIGIHAVGEFEGAPYLVMEYVPGQSLQEFLEARGHRPLGVDAALGVLDQVCRGLSAIHAAGLVHRDLKPGNVLIGPAFRVAIADLGIARLLADVQASEELFVSGTPSYMAPEVLLLQPTPAELAPRADIFSLGVLAYQLFTGELPLGRRVPFAEAPGSLEAASDLNPELPPELDAVLAEALSLFPEHRTRSADAFRRAVVKAVHQNTKSEFAPERILVADDDRTYQDLIRMVLIRAFPGAVIECVGDGLTALEVAERSPPDLVVSDLDMPGMNGVELTIALRSLPELGEVPIIVATAVGGPTDWRLLSDLGADGFLGKPFEPAQLVALARGVLDPQQRNASRQRRLRARA